MPKRKKTARRLKQLHDTNTLIILVGGGLVILLAIMGIYSFKAAKNKIENKTMQYQQTATPGAAIEDSMDATPPAKAY